MTDSEKNWKIFNQSPRKRGKKITATADKITA